MGAVGAEGESVQGALGAAVFEAGVGTGAAVLLVEVLDDALVGGGEFRHARVGRKFRREVEWASVEGGIRGGEQPVDGVCYLAL